MHHLQAENKISLLTLIFHDLVITVQGNVKTIPYNMHLTYLIRKMGCNVNVDLLLYQSKYTSFDKHNFGRMQYIKDAQGNYVKKLDKELEPEEPKDDVLKPLT